MKIAKAKNNPDMMRWNERLHIVCAYFKQAQCMKHFSHSSTYNFHVVQAIAIAKGIEYLHGRSIVHASLKSTSVLFDATGEVKIGDLNLSTMLKGSMPSTSSSAVSDPRWLAPEILGGGQIYSSCDVFSFGVILWELLELCIPWENNTYDEIFRKVQSGERLPIHYYGANNQEICSLESHQKFSHLIQSCWHQNPAERPSIRTLLESLSSRHGHTAEDFTAPTL